MAKLDNLFKTFLSNIEPKKKAVDYAIDAHKPIREHLKEDEEFKEYYVDTFLYGSYRRHTAVSDIKDVDIVVLTNFDHSDEKNTPNKVLRKLKDALSRYYDDPENPEYQRRSIRINDPLPDEKDTEMTLDVIPAVEDNGADKPLKVPDRVVKEWIDSHPKGHINNTSRLNEDGDKRFVPLVKIMKYWWKYQCELRQPDAERPQPKGFWVECLTGDNLDTSQHFYADHFIAVLENVSEKYSDVDKVPELEDPGIKNEKIKCSMTIDEFEIFIEAVNDSLDLAIKARDKEDELESSELWQEIFGEEFPLYDEEETEDSRKQSKAVSLGDTSHIRPPNWSFKISKKVRIDAYVYKQSLRLGGINSDGRIIPDDMKLRFVAITNAKGSYEVFWHVVNTGSHAARTQGGLRGKEYFKARLSDNSPSSDPHNTWERTEYTGKHWIECFIVKNEVCIARSGRFYVNVKNKNF